MKMGKQARRALRALAIVGCILAAAPISAQAQSLAVASAGLGQAVEAALHAGSDGGTGGDAAAVSDYANALGVETAGELPGEFAMECVDLSNKEGLLVSAGGNLVSYVEQVQCEDSFLSLATCLEEKGWTWVKSGDDAQATFVKDCGRYRWLYAACVDIGSGTSVVIQVVPDG